MIGVAAHGAAVDVRHDETFYVNANRPDIVRSVSVSKASTFELDSTDCFGATIDSDTYCEITVRWTPPAEGAFRETVVVEIVADSGAASIQYEAVSLSPAPTDPVTGDEPEILVHDPPTGPNPDRSVREGSDVDGDRSRRSGADVSGQNRPDPEGDQPDNAGSDAGQDGSG
jgi:hypothetical protein